MSLAIVHSRTLIGLQAPAVTVEAHISNGLPRLSIVGLPEKAVRESNERVRSAIINSHFEFPIRRITINLAPADLPKDSGRFDLPIALGILAASKQIPTEILNDYEFVGELALTGELRPITGSLPLAMASKQTQRKLFLPHANAAEASLVEHVPIFAAEHLLQVCAHLRGQALLTPYVMSDNTLSSDHFFNGDLAEIQGQQHAKRALLLAASGGHSLLLVGPPGTGKTMLAQRLITILPPLTEQESLEAAMILSIANKQASVSKHWRQRPFRAPHHTASSIALVGGSSPPRPGEISLAHHGVLFLDELPEFNRHVLEALREPMESGHITISRAALQAEFPAKFHLVTAMNPCPCGYYGDALGNCRCTPEQVARYHRKLSGPLLDRIDLHVAVPRLEHALLLRAPSQTCNSSAELRAQVIATRALQMQRAGKLNSALTGQEIKHYCKLTTALENLLVTAAQRLQLSARSFHRILKVARTLADMQTESELSEAHLLEALSYRDKIGKS